MSLAMRKHCAVAMAPRSGARRANLLLLLLLLLLLIVICYGITNNDKATAEAALESPGLWPPKPGRIKPGRIKRSTLVSYITLIYITTLHNANTQMVSPLSKEKPREPDPWGNTNRVVSNRVVSIGPLCPSKTTVIILFVF